MCFKNRPRQWIYDRVHGMSKLGQSKPTFSVCYPPPILKCFPWLCEENCICTCIGARGGYDGDDRAGRESVMRIAFSANLCAWILTAYACISLYENFKIIEISSLHRATMDPVQAKEATADVLQSINFETITLDIGWRSVAINNPNTFGEQIIFFDEFCELKDRGIERYLEPDDCGKCDDIGYQLIIAIIVGAVAYFPSFGTDFTRLHKNYDVNCQRVVGLVLSLISIAGAVYAYLIYDSECFSSFHDGRISFDKDGNLLPSGTDSGIALVMEIKWEIGYGLIILWAGAGLKVIHLLCHCCIPTPNITRSLKEQADYEAIGQEVEEEGLIDIMAEGNNTPAADDSSESASSSDSSDPYPKPTPATKKKGIMNNKTRADDESPDPYMGTMNKFGRVG